MAASEAAAAHDVRAWPLSRFHLGPPAAGTESLLLGYAAYDDRQIRDAVERLRRALAQCAR